MVEVPEDMPGDEVECVNDGCALVSTAQVPMTEVSSRRTTGHAAVVVDGERVSKAEMPSLETFAGQQFGSFVLHASRLDDTLWEVTVLPL